MSEKGLKYVEIYGNSQDDPTPVKTEGGLSGFWADLPKDHSAQKWKIEDGQEDAENVKTNNDTPIPRKGFSIGLGRSIDLLCFMAETGFDCDNKRVVEIGCGDGRLSLLMAEAGATVHAIEPSAKQIQLFRQLETSPTTRQHAQKVITPIDGVRVAGIPGLIFINKTRAEHLPIADNSMDAVVMKFTLQWTDDKQTVSEIRRVLKPGGDLFLMTTIHSSKQPELFSRAWNSIVSDCEKDGKHFSNFSSPKNPIAMHHLPTLTDWMASQGLDLQRTRTYLEETGKNPQFFLLYLTAMFREQLKFYAEGGMDMDENVRNRLLAERMTEIAVNEGRKANVEETLAMLHFKKRD